MIMQPSQRQAVREMNHEKAKKIAESPVAQEAVREIAKTAAEVYGGKPAEIGVSIGSITEAGKNIVKKTAEIIIEGFEELGRTYTFDDLP